MGLQAYLMIKETKRIHLATRHKLANGKCSGHFRFYCRH